jgi:hypothetical protein
VAESFERDSLNLISSLLAVAYLFKHNASAFAPHLFTDLASNTLPRHTSLLAASFMR